MLPFFHIFLIISQINTFGPKKTDAEQMSDLLKQMQDECNIDERSGHHENSEVTVSDIEDRLDKLKGREPKNRTGESFTIHIKRFR